MTSNIWSVKLDWLNIVNLLNLESIDDIPEDKKNKAIRRISRIHDLNELLELPPSQLDTMVAEELSNLMKKELVMIEKERERKAKEFQGKVIPMKHGGIIRLNPNDFKDLDPDAKPEDILKYLYKKFMGKDKDDDNDDKDRDRDRLKEDKTGYYI